MQQDKKIENLLFRRFYKKTGILLTDEPIYASEWEEKNVERLGIDAQIRPRRAIPQLKRAIANHPETPSLKNYLYVAYMKTGQKANAEKVLEQTLEEHPNYVFGVTNKVLNTRGEKELREVGHLLRNPRDVRAFAEHDQPIHISVFKNYQFAAAHFEMTIGEDDSAVERLETLMDVGIEQDFLNKMARSLAMSRIERMAKRMKDKKAKSREVEGIQKVYLHDQTVDEPSLTHSELEVFYKTSVQTLSENKQNQLINLPRATLLQDLEIIVQDTMKRWDEHFMYTDYEQDSHEFTIHALYFLGALKAEESLQTILDLFRMGKDFIEYWFNDSLDDILQPVLFDIGQNQLAELKDFVLEKNISGFHKLTVTSVLPQVALHYSNRRAEVIQWFSEVIQFFLDNPTDDELIDTNFLSFMLSSIADFSGKELFPLVKQLWDKGWIMEDAMGDINTIEKEINKDVHLSRRNPIPQNIHEYYSKSYFKRRIAPPHDPELDEIKRKLETKGEKLISKYWSEMMFGVMEGRNPFSQNVSSSPTTSSSPPRMIKRKKVKVSRNAPCPCGSGKKYKKCCMRKR